MDATAELKWLLLVRGPKAIFWVNLDLESIHIKCFIIDSESPDSKSARCQVVTLGIFELFTFSEKELKNKNKIIKNIILLNEPDLNHCKSIQGDNHVKGNDSFSFLKGFGP